MRTSARDAGGRQSPRQRDGWPPGAAGQIEHAELACTSRWMSRSFGKPAVLKTSLESHLHARAMRQSRDTDS